jgi:hypothetical protein
MHMSDEDRVSGGSGERYLDEQGRYLRPRDPVEPPIGADEAATLIGYLERQRATFAWKLYARRSARPR